jgi:hypothetical protein
VTRGGLNYVACQLYFGDMSLQEASRSASLFAEHVISDENAVHATPARQRSALV